VPIVGDCRSKTAPRRSIGLYSVDMSSSKSKGKSKAPSGSSKQDVPSQAKDVAKTPAAPYKIVGDLATKEIWHPDGENLIDNPFDLWYNPDWITAIEDRKEFEIEYHHYRGLWKDEHCDELLERTFGGIRQDLSLNQCISIGLGNFAPKTIVPVKGQVLGNEKKPRGPRDHVRQLSPTMHQLMFLWRLVGFLNIPRDKVFFQDPIFTDFEKKYLQHCFHSGCILDPHVGEDCPSGAQAQLTATTFLMAPMVSEVLSEVLQPVDKAPGLYVGTQMLRMIKAQYPHLKQEELSALKTPFNRYRVRTSSKRMARFIEAFDWPDNCEIRYLKPEK